jgi:hypothetical protein
LNVRLCKSYEEFELDFGLQKQKKEAENEIENIYTNKRAKTLI